MMVNARIAVSGQNPKRSLQSTSQIGTAMQNEMAISVSQIRSSQRGTGIGGS